MSFFGFDTALPRDGGAQRKAPGFSAPHDAFAGLSSKDYNDDGDALDFEDTYDGLADQLDETDDAFNDDTFDMEPASQQAVGRDFDFSGQTAKISNTIQEEQMLYQARQPPPKASPPKRAVKPARTGYENYAKPEYIPQLEANASLWGMAPKPAEARPQHMQDSQQAPAAKPARKAMTLDEVEAMMRSQPQQSAAPPSHPMMQQMPPQQYQTPPPQGMGGPPPGFGGPPQILQRPQRMQEQQQPAQAELPAQSRTPQQPQILQRQPPQQPEPQQQNRGQRPPQPQQPQNQAQAQAQNQTQGPPQQPRQILQNPNRLSGHGQPVAPAGPRQAQPPHGMPIGPQHGRGPSYPGGVITHPQQLLNLTDEERAAYLVEDAKRAKRIHKIHMLSKDNGLMTPQDKNFITRIQLQQLVTATGSVDEQRPEAVLNEDFYYQVFSQIRGAPRQNPNQPANHFAQTYLFQTGGRYGMAGRRQNRGGDNHMQRMEQQVQRAVEAAKAKPKNKQLVIEGSLGKISFSNAKTPKPLLNIKRQDSNDGRPHSRNASKAQHQNGYAVDRKTVLRDLENIYSALMEMEDHERKMPPPMTEESDADTIQAHMEWRERIQQLNQNLWQSLKVMEPISQDPNATHPFIAILSHPKGKKAVPRIVSHIDEQQRITIITMIVVHLDTLDVIRDALRGPSEPSLAREVREEVDLFANAVLPNLFNYVNEAPLHIVAGLLGLVLDRTNVSTLVRTRIGVNILTLLVTRAELVRQTTPSLPEGEWEQWLLLYNRLFDMVEPSLGILFPGSVNDVEDVYVWQFLAAMGVMASPEQQQRLVLGVKDRVMETVGVSKALPKELAATRLGHVNLFMTAIGLDVGLLG